MLTPKAWMIIILAWIGKHQLIWPYICYCLTLLWVETRHHKSKPLKYIEYKYMVFFILSYVFKSGSWFRGSLLSKLQEEKFQLYWRTDALTQRLSIYLCQVADKNYSTIFFRNRGLQNMYTNLPENWLKTFRNNA